MERFKPIINNLCKTFKKCFKNYSIKECIVIPFLFIYVVVSYNSEFFKWYDEVVIPILSQLKSNIWLIIFTYIMLIIIVNDFITKYKNRYQYSPKIIILLLFLLIQMLFCRFSNNYHYDYTIWHLGISYFEVLILVTFSYIISAIINIIRLFYECYKKIGTNPSNSINTSNKNSILEDWPIEDVHDDVLKLNEEAKKIAERIKSLEPSRTWSIAITASWGTGKTSFINLIKNNIDEQNIEMISFVPRDSKSFRNIQEDFFSLIACVLSKYDSRCDHVFKDYMASLQLIDNRGIIEKFLNLYRIWNKEELKNDIENSFVSLKKKILVFIDDFDRLSKDEILEVLKLIDSNAAFTNLIFVTAYDKEQVNISLGESFQTKDACFIDKFFNLEYPIPSRPYSYISRYLEQMLCRLPNINGADRKLIMNVINYRNNIFQEYIPTLRDAKRYINQVKIDYEFVGGDVFVDEYLLVELIKYRYPELYKCTFRKDYLEKRFLTNRSNLYLKKGLDETLKILNILQILFDHENTSVTSSYHHIYEAQSFNNYFVNDIFSSLRNKDMACLFEQDWEKVIITLDSWITNNAKINNFLDYLESFATDTFKDGSFFIRYVEMNAYLACKLPSSQFYRLFLRAINTQEFSENDGIYHLNHDSYKKDILEIIKNNDSRLTLIADIHVNFMTENLLETDLLIKDADLWPFIKEKFMETAEDPSTDDKWLLGFLHKCIDHMDVQRHLYLDQDCLKAYRKRVVKNPDFYINNFVFLGGVSSNPGYNSVACDAFWPQIFKNAGVFEKFLEYCTDKNIDKYVLVSNFWQLYKANKYRPIQYSGNDPVQDKIDNNLVEEIEKLTMMKKIDDDISALCKKKIIQKDDIRLLKAKKEELRNINLEIDLKSELKVKIYEKLNQLKAI